MAAPWDGSQPLPPYANLYELALANKSVLQQPFQLLAVTFNKVQTQTNMEIYTICPTYLKTDPTPMIASGRAFAAALDAALRPKLEEGLESFKHEVDLILTSAPNCWELLFRWFILAFDRQMADAGAAHSRVGVQSQKYRVFLEDLAPVFLRHISQTGPAQAARQFERSIKALAAIESYITDDNLALLLYMADPDLAHQTERVLLAYLVIHRSSSESLINLPFDDAMEQVLQQRCPQEDVRQQKRQAIKTYSVGITAGLRSHLLAKHPQFHSDLSSRLDAVHANWTGGQRQTKVFDFQTGDEIADRYGVAE